MKHPPLLICYPTNSGHDHVDVDRDRHLEVIQTVVDLLDDIVPRRAPDRSLGSVARRGADRLETGRALGILAILGVQGVRPATEWPRAGLVNASDGLEGAGVDHGWDDGWLRRDGLIGS